MNKHVTAAPRDLTPRAASAQAGNTARDYMSRDRQDQPIVTRGNAKKDAKDIVLSCITALNHGDFNAAKGLVAENMTFLGVLGSRNGAEAYFRDMERMKLKYDIKKVFADNNDVCLFYDLHMSDLIIFGCGWYHVENGKITSLRVVFDPRPVLEHSGHH